MSTVPAKYSRVAICLHWVIAFLIALNVGGGFYLGKFASSADQQALALHYHASLGIVIFSLALIRLAWRLSHQPPALPASIPRWQQRASDVVHWALYVLMLTVPMTGFLFRTAGGHVVNFFGLANLPLFIHKNETLRTITGTLHVMMVWLLVALVVGHIAAALKHRFIDRDGVAERMLRW
jgi:cytochrome b561